jgi:hypothetical protein
MFAASAVRQKSHLGERVLRVSQSFPVGRGVGVEAPERSAGGMGAIAEHSVITRQALAMSGFSNGV